MVSKTGFFSRAPLQEDWSAIAEPKSKFSATGIEGPSVVDDELGVEVELVEGSEALDVVEADGVVPPWQAANARTR